MIPDHGKMSKYAVDSIYYDKMVNVWISHYDKVPVISGGIIDYYKIIFSLVRAGQLSYK